ncbi:AbrB/MazE/SpoVT family DNA-binding domain-containing protein [Carbonactinospora thermoautotrophica]|uniref:AbrB/MazE/SpoVT family DNA-binding domain-containing protein n=1 Tax=Carbonactinospora thermoautotrophica TaxID=1469144 RepID=UPI002270903F|nr:AbrB/MazE/SpoVT family DNA-binding domain-containing protein [Carbonactinospora thermoautotrophica]
MVLEEAGMVTGTAKLGQEGRLRIPAEVRRDAHLQEGQELVIISEGPGRLRLTTREALQAAVWAAAGGGQHDAIADVRAFRDAEARELEDRVANPPPAGAGDDEIGQDLLRELGL